MTRTSIGEYTEEVRWRYLRSSKKDKDKILDEFTKVTWYHRKAVVRLLHRESHPSVNKKRGRHTLGLKYDLYTTLQLFFKDLISSKGIRQWISMGN